MSVELSYERGRLSKKAQEVVRDIDVFFKYYRTAKRTDPPVIRVASEQFEAINSSLKRLKIIFLTILT